jgi:hypothetical protein
LFEAALFLEDFTAFLVGGRFFFRLILVFTFAFVSQWSRSKFSSAVLFSAITRQLLEPVRPNPQNRAKLKASIREA